MGTTVQISEEKEDLAFQDGLDGDAAVGLPDLESVARLLGNVVTLLGKQGVDLA